MLQTDLVFRTSNAFTGSLLLILSFASELCWCGQACPFLDSFGKVRYRWCEANCCGDTHQSHCCLQKEVGQIVFGSLGGVVFLVAIVIGSLVCCRHHNVCFWGYTGTYDRLVPTNRYREERPIVAAAQDYGSTASVAITVTPPEDSEKSYRVISRPEPTFGSFQPAPLSAAQSPTNTNIESNEKKADTEKLDNS